MSILRPGDRQRYNLQSEVALAAQQRWQDRSVLVVGEGPLAAEAAWQLAAVGTGTVGLDLSGNVAEKDLGATGVFRAADAGRPIAAVALERLRERNPRCHVVDASTEPGSIAYDFGFVVATARGEFPGGAMVRTHYLWEVASGAAALTIADRGCPHCCGLAPAERPAGGAAATGARSFLLSDLAFRVILGLGASTLPNVTTVLLDGTDMLVASRVVEPTGCSRCSQPTEAPAPLVLQAAPAPWAQSVRATDVAALARAGIRLVDVREPHEAEIVSIPGSELVPLSELAAAAESWERGRRVLVYCKTGARSGRAVQWLVNQGFDAANLEGGILSWIELVHPEAPRY